MHRAVVWVGLLGTALVPRLAAAECPELLQNNEFTASAVAPWQVTASDPTGLSYQVSDDQYKTLNIVVNNIQGTDDVQVELSQVLPITAGHVYNVSYYSLGSTSPGAVAVSSANSTMDYGLNRTVIIGDGKTVKLAFQATATDASAKFALRYSVPFQQYLFEKFDSLFVEDTSAPACDVTGGGGNANGGNASGGNANGGSATSQGGREPGDGGSASQTPSEGGAGAEAPLASGGAGPDDESHGVAGADLGEVGGACIPGRRVACACPSSTLEGTQTCDAEGSGYGECTGCPTPSESSSGCGCRLSPGGPNPSAWSLAGLALWLAVRRRSAGSRSTPRKRGRLNARSIPWLSIGVVGAAFVATTGACSNRDDGGGRAPRGAAGQAGEGSVTSPTSGRTGEDQAENEGGGEGGVGSTDSTSAAGAGASDGGVIQVPSGGTGGTDPGGLGGTAGTGAGGGALGGSAGSNGQLAASMIAAGESTTCAVLHDHTVRCWGHNNLSQVGDGSSNDAYAPSVPVLGITNALGVAVGLAHACAVLSDGHVKCWGNNASGQLGNGKKVNSPAPVTASSIDTAIAVAAGPDDSCALLNGGKIRCWGSNEAGQLGDGTTASSGVPVEVVGIDDAVAVATGYYATCALRSGGGVLCWGSNQSGQLGNGTAPSSAVKVPGPVSNISTAVSLSFTYQHACVALSSGGVQCWGDNASGQLGNNSVKGSNIPVPASNLSSANTVAAGQSHTCAGLKDSSLSCWGSNSYLALGTAALTSFTPQAVASVSAASAVVTGNQYTCSLLHSGSVLCWGNNLYGRLGLPGSPLVGDHPTVVAGF